MFNIYNKCIVYIILIILILSPTVSTTTSQANATTSLTQGYQKKYDLSIPHSQDEIIVAINNPSQYLNATTETLRQEENIIIQSICREYNIDKTYNNNLENKIEIRSAIQTPKSLYLLKTYNVAETLAILNLDGRIAYAEPNYIYEPLLIPNDPLFKQQSLVLGSIGWQEALEYNPQSNVPMFFQDTGLDINHEDIRDSLKLSLANPVNGQLVKSWDFVNNSSDVTEREVTHGTPTAGIAAATVNNSLGIAGTMPNATLFECKVATPGGGVDGWAVVNSTYYIIEKMRGNGAVINASFGGRVDSQSLRDAVASAVNNNIMYVAAAGNSSTDNDQLPYFPAGYPGVVSVGSFDSDTEEFSSYSNYGRNSVTIIGPNNSIGSLTTVQQNQYQRFGGTSISTPYVSGAGAMLMSFGLTAKKARDMLMLGATRLKRLENKTASGLLNLKKSIELIKNSQGQDIVDIIGPEIIEVKAKVQFYVLVPNNSQIYEWDFGDGGTSSEQNPIHKFKKLGRYTIKLKITDQSKIINSYLGVQITDKVTILSANILENKGIFKVIATSSRLNPDSPSTSLNLMIIDANTGTILSSNSFPSSFDPLTNTFVFRGNINYFTSSVIAKIISFYGGRAEVNLN